MVSRCRLSGSSNLTTVLSLGTQSLTGVFPQSITEEVPEGELDLAWCPDSNLLQLRHSFPLDQLYGDNYGYRSGLNASMVNHLNSKVRSLERLVNLLPGDFVIDIGSNDSTLLRSYTTSQLSRIGVDPTAAKYASFYPPDISYLADFFPSPRLDDFLGNHKAKIITSIAMFYDLEDPVSFAREISTRLESNGVWHLEQSYMPSMLRLNSYDTICHEHLEYYTLHNVVDILELADLSVIDVQMNSINGGSFAVTAAHKGSHHQPNAPVINWILEQEKVLLSDPLRLFSEFSVRVQQHRLSLTALLDNLTSAGKKVYGYGASTKGNVVLQYCNLNSSQLPFIVDVNPDKNGCYTPGSHIPIIDEATLANSFPDFYLLLPWHFKESVLRREESYLRSGGKFIIPFPEIEIIGY